jgi:hypothetical protein
MVLGLACGEERSFLADLYRYLVSIPFLPLHGESRTFWLWLWRMYVFHLCLLHFLVT